MKVSAWHRSKALELVISLGGMMAGYPGRNALAWVRNLPEVGAPVLGYATRLDTLDARIDAALTLVASLDTERRSLVRDAEAQIRSQWAGNEIDEAKVRTNV